MKQWGFETICQHLAEDYGFADAVTPPIFQTSLFVQDQIEDFQIKDPDRKKFYYTRVSNPTTDIVEQKIAALEETEKCRLFASGMGAISAAIMSACEAGKHIVITNASYGPSKAFVREYLPQFNVEYTFVDGQSVQEIRDSIRPNTTCIYMESPGTFFFHVQDIKQIAELAKTQNITTVLDNSHATPYFQKPATFGVDLVVHTATKYLGGHSDIVCGAVCGSQERMSKLIWEEGLMLGSVLDPFAAWLLLRSLRTLPLRMERHQESGKRIAEYLNGHPKVDEVFHLSLAGHPGYALAKTQMSGTTGLVSFRPKFQDKESVKRFCEGLELFQMGVSWGGHESLIVPANIEETGGEWLLRVSVGLETCDDLIADLEKQLNAV